MRRPRRTIGGATNWQAIITLSLLVAVSNPGVGFPQETEHHEPAAEHEATGEKHEAEAASGESHGEGHLHKHHVALFVGSTEAEEHHGEKGDPDFTLGFDYERRLSRLFGIGGRLDWVAEGRREVLIGPIGFLHASKGLRLYAAPCYQREREGCQDNFVLRVGGTWDFHIGRYVIGPHVIYDFGEEHNFLVLGVGFGRGF